MDSATPLVEAQTAASSELVGVVTYGGKGRRQAVRQLGNLPTAAKGLTYGGKDGGKQCASWETYLRR